MPFCVSERISSLLQRLPGCLSRATQPASLCFERGEECSLFYELDPRLGVCSDAVNGGCFVQPVIFHRLNVFVTAVIQSTQMRLWSSQSPPHSNLNTSMEIDKHAPAVGFRFACKLKTSVWPTNLMHVKIDGTPVKGAVQLKIHLKKKHVFLPTCTDIYPSLDKYCSMENLEAADILSN